MYLIFFQLSPVKGEVDDEFDEVVVANCLLLSSPLELLLGLLFGLPLYIKFNLVDVELKEQILYWTVIIIFSIISGVIGSI